MIVHSDTSTVADHPFEAFVKQLQSRLSSLGRDILLAPPATYYDIVRQSPEQAAGLVSADEHYTLISGRWRHFEWRRSVPPMRHLLMLVHVAALASVRDKRGPRHDYAPRRCRSGR